MKKALLILVVVLAIAIAGCSGGGEEKGEKQTPTPEQTPVSAKTPTPETEKTATPEKTEEPSTPPPSTGFKTLYDLYLNRKVLHGIATITVEGQKETYEFWYYFDDDTKELLVRMDTTTGEGKGSGIMRYKYEGDKLIMTMYMKGDQMGDMGDCDWIEIKQITTVSPSEYEDVKEESVTESFEATMTRQGNIVENYKVDYVDYDPSIFQPDGKVCSMGSFVGGPGG